MSGFDYIIEDIKKGNLTYDSQKDTSCPGTLAIVAVNRLLPYPVGMIWFRWRGSYAADILNMYVVADLRRLGIATYLHEKMIACCADLTEIYTQNGNAHSTPWLKAIGFKRRSTGWYFEVKRRK